MGNGFALFSMLLSQSRIIKVTHVIRCLAGSILLKSCYSHAKKKR